MQRFKTLNIFPFWCRFLSLFLMIFGIVSSYYFIYLSIKPAFLQLNVFTVYSKFIETTKFSFIKNNQGDELAILSYICGFLLFLFADGRISASENFQRKASALICAFVSVMLLIIITTVLVHGSPVLIISFLLLFLIPVLFVLFYFLLRNVKRVDLIK